MSSFAWGVSGAAYQIEGAWDSDGKLPSIWDDYCRMPGNIADGSDAKTSCDFYHHFQEDIDLARQAGFEHFRMSISWPRVVQDDGRPNQGGIAFYNRVFDALEQAGLAPWVTLYHWDLPASLQTPEMPGWMSAEIIGHFTNFARICFDCFSCRVPNWITFNEPAIFVFGGYLDGWQAPGIRQSLGEAHVAMRHVLLAHAAAVALYRKEYQPAAGGRIGIALNTRHYAAVDGSEEAQAGAQSMLEARIASWSDPVVFGDFPASVLTEHAGSSALFLSQDEQRQLKGSVDFLGVNYYTTSGVEKSGDGGAWKIVDVGTPSGTDWLRSYPAGLIELLRWLSDRYPGLDLVITENGLCTAGDDPNVLDDAARVDYYAQHVAAAQEALNEGLPLRGYFAWTLLDNFEWAGGYQERFGIVHVDFGKEERPRSIKQSYRWWQEFLKKSMPEDYVAPHGMSLQMLPQTPAEVINVLCSFGRDPDGARSYLLTTEMGLPKYIVALRTGEEVFLGSIFGNSKTSDDVVASMRAAQIAATQLPESSKLSIAGYFETQEGELLASGEEGRRWMATSYFKEKVTLPNDRYTPRQTCAYRLPGILGQLHLALREAAASPESLKFYPSVDTLGEVQATLARIASQELPIPSELLDSMQPVIEAASRLTGDVALKLDELPRQVIHSDFQPKNLLLSADGETIRVCDTETMLQGPRIVDLNFLFYGSDEAELAGDWHTVVDRLEEYIIASWPLSEQEMELLPSALMLNAMGIAAWAAKKLSNPGKFTCAKLVELAKSFSSIVRSLLENKRMTVACKLAQCYAGHTLVELPLYASFYARASDVIDESLPQFPPLLAGQRGAAVFYNGTFSPPHAGHLATAQLAASTALRLGYHQAVVVFSPCHDDHEKGKLGTAAAGITHRKAMLALAGCKVDEYESSRDARREVLEAVQAAFVRRLPPGYEAVFLVGADVAYWRWIRRKLAIGTHVLIVVNRSGSDPKVSKCEMNSAKQTWPGTLHVARGEDLGKSSSRIRAAAIGGNDLAAEMGIPAVADYIHQHSLYGSKPG